VAAAGLPMAPQFWVGMGLTQALDCFSKSLAVLQTPDVVARVASEICVDAAADGVSSLEIRFAPQLHGGAPDGDIVDAALQGIGGRAGLILCGLYGESPEVLAQHVALASSRLGVVGIDLAGGPSPGHAWSMSDYSAPFLAAKRIGLGRTVHAAEGRAPSEIRTAILELAAQRIGHGTTLLADPSVVALVRERRVTMEACLTSNVHTGVIADVAEHPLSQWIDRGVRCCINTDNTWFSGVRASEEHHAALAIRGMTAERVDQVVSWGHEAVFSR
jgi:adenosine deaminase